MTVNKYTVELNFQLAEKAEYTNFAKSEEDAKEIAIYQLEKGRADFHRMTDIKATIKKKD